MRWLRRISVMACGALLLGCLGEVPSLAAAPAAHSAAAVQSAGSTRHSASTGGIQPTPGPARLPDPAKVLPSGWQHSADEAVAVAGDATGLHVLAAREASGYAWRTVATLGDSAVETHLWIGQACVTGSGRYAVVVYAPEQVANMAGAQGVLGRAAIVDLRTGAVRELGGGFSVAYFDPGCGIGSQAVLTKGGWANDTSTAAMSTTLVLADAATGTVTATVKVPGQVTSAIPYSGQIVAAGGEGLEQISTAGKTRLLAAAATVPFRLTPAADGSLGYQTMAGKKVDLWHLVGGHSRQVASAQAGSVELRQIGGRVWLVGPQASKVAGLPRQWQPVDAPVIAQPSTTGALAVTAAGPAAPVRGQRYDPGRAQPVVISARLLTGKGGTASFKVATTAAPPAAAPVGAAKARTSAGGAVSRAASGAAAAATPGSPTTPVSADRTCAIPIDDPSIQAYQPNFKQVEWAADQAVQNNLKDTRPAGLYGSSLPSYTPQGLFPLPNGGVLDGGGSLPAQVLLGIVTAESNLQQASRHVIQGQTSNPLTSFNWYGNWINGETTNTGLVNWSNSDCGYGIGQITTGMCLAQGQNGADQCANAQTMTSEEQLAVAVDYQANIAKAAQMLMNDWNMLWALNIKPNGYSSITLSGTSDPKYIDNWYMAAWAYNSGLEPGSPKYGNTTGCSPSSSCTDGGGNWGLGYADNPINPAYPPDRPTFPTSSPNGYPGPGGATYSSSWDMSHPQYWPYQEKVLAWAFDSITLWDYSQGKNVQAFAYAHGNFTAPPIGLFCTTSVNHCDASGVDVTKATGPDACQLSGNYTDHCWWHQTPADTWPIQVGTLAQPDAGTQVIIYGAGAADPGPEPIAAQFAQTCASSLPSNAVIVGEGGKSALGCPGQNWASKGSFTWNFAADSNGNYSSKIAFDQIGAGFGGHFWFGYAQPSAQPSATVITGTWTPPSSVTGWADIQVAIPSYGANAGDANYQVNPGGGKPGRDVLINQGATAGTNTWVNLGDFNIGSGASVSLSNVTPDTITINGGGTGSDIAWSAAAFIPVSGPQWTYTAMGDSYSSGEGNPPYDPGTAGGCDRSAEAFGRQFAVGQSDIGNAGIQHIACSGATINNLMTNGTGQNGEQPQISQMFTGSKLVTVTIGGNDVGFAGVLTYCLTNPATCESNYNTDNTSNLYTKIDALKSNLITVYGDMHKQAPNAKIVAVTYPNIFKPGTTCPGILNLPVPDVQFLISVGLYLDNTIIAAAHDAGINVMDERYAFLGHELCSSNPWVYSLPTGFQPGTSVLDTSAWFHPTSDGHGQIAADLAAYWQALKSGPGPAIWPVSVPAPPSGWLPLNLPHGIPTTAQAQAMLAALTPVANPTTAGYPGGAGWSTRNGCSTRYRVLQAQALTQAQWSQAVQYAAGTGCVPLSGSWETAYDVTPGSPTTPVRVSFTNNANGIAAALPVDHVVAQANAWATGANNWQTAYGAMGTVMLTDFANDMSGPELLTISTSSNSQKQDSGPESWMPQNTGMTCAFVKMWIAVKWDWSLGVSTQTGGKINGESEQAALQSALNSC
jgi:lysophospholipase L1-like esterase